MKHTFGLAFLWIALFTQACHSERKLAGVNQYQLRDVSYRIDDQRITRIVYAAKKKSLLKKGQRYNESRLGRERERLTKLIQKNGIMDFNIKAVSFLIDTTLANQPFAIITVIQTH